MSEEQENKWREEFETYKDHRMNSVEVPSFENHEKFLSRIVVNGECWEFRAGENKGYAGFYMRLGYKKYKTFRAQRVSWSVFKGDIEKGMVIDHICKNIRCVNPDHLRKVSNFINITENSENIIAHNKNKTHCIRGHEFNTFNTYLHGSHRHCRVCRNIRKIEKAKKLVGEK